MLLVPDQLQSSKSVNTEEEEEVLVVTGSMSETTHPTEPQATCDTICSGYKSKCQDDIDQGHEYEANDDGGEESDVGNNDDDDDDDDDDDFADFYVPSKPRNMESVVSKQLSLPVILRLIDPEVDVVHLIRLLMCQVILCHSNSKARAAVEKKQYFDFATRGMHASINHVIYK